MDALVGGYFCKRLKLPCFSPDDCVTPRDLDVIMTEQEYMNR